MTEKDVTKIYGILLEMNGTIGEIKGRTEDIPKIREEVSKMDVIEEKVDNMGIEQTLQGVVLRGNGEPEKGVMARLTKLENIIYGIGKFFKWFFSKKGLAASIPTTGILGTLIWYLLR